MSRLKRHAFLIILLCACGPPAFAGNYLLNGGQASRIEYRLTQRVTPSPNTRKVYLTFVAPETFKSPTYSQIIEKRTYRFDPRPSERKDYRDKRGNAVIDVMWRAPEKTIEATMALTASNSVRLAPLKTDAPFPLETAPPKIRVYLKATPSVGSDHPEIRAKARSLTAGCKTQFDAVQKILTWVVDHMRYVIKPAQYNSLYAFKKGRGNCQNYSHLTAALMRANGIPVRIVNGVTLNKPYDIKTGHTVMTLKMAKSRHSWIEVWFPDLGWVPFDPQGSQLFVSNRFIRVEVGVDNRETEKDGLLKWTRIRGTSGRPGFAESIEADFATDSIQLTADKTDYGPRALLLSPHMKTAFTKVKTAPRPKIPDRIPAPRLKQYDYLKSLVFGNLEFPENENFINTRGPAIENPDGSMSMKKNFLVETAEYVTTKGRQYAQTFILKRPLKLRDIGLALHSFGDDGQLWIELYQDKNSMPGRQIATSDFLSLHQIPHTPGYAWVNFTFPGRPLILSPGRYWIALGFTGSPVVNWFYTYGKPVGPQDGTRYKILFDTTWSRSLAFEFNYRVRGMTPPPTARQ